MLRVLRAGAIVALATLAACGTGSPLPIGPIGAPVDREHAQAEAALARWAAAAASGGSNAIGIVGEGTGQIGEWEGPVGENNKVALMAGMIRIADDIPDDAPPRGTVTRADGTTQSVRVLSAREALRALVGATSENAGVCPECRPLTITSARLVDGPIETSQGAATAPTWQFTLEGTRVIVTQVAIAETVDIQPPPWDHPTSWARIVAYFFEQRFKEEPRWPSLREKPRPRSATCAAAIMR